MFLGEYPSMNFVFCRILPDQGACTFPKEARVALLKHSLVLGFGCWSLVVRPDKLRWALATKTGRELSIFCGEKGQRKAAYMMRASIKMEDPANLSAEV